MRHLIWLLIACAPAYGYHHHKHHHEHHKGFKRGANKLEGSKHVSFLKATEDVPSSYSLVPVVSVAGDQGAVGSCWAWSTTTTLRDTFMSLAKDPGELAVNFILDCNKQEAGCNGGDISAGNFMVSPKGPYLNSFYPYTASCGRCKKGPVAASATSYNLLGTAALGPSFKDIAYVISVLHSPVVTEISASQFLEDYDSGVIDQCSDLQTDHMVEFLGYSTEGGSFDANGNLPPGVGYYIVKNSWSTTWGENGNFRIKATGLDGKRCDTVGAEAGYFTISTKPLPISVPVTEHHWYCFWGIFCSTDAADHPLARSHIGR